MICMAIIKNECSFFIIYERAPGIKLPSSEKASRAVDWAQELICGEPEGETHCLAPGGCVGRDGCPGLGVVVW